jgi:hypothetical protein
VNSKVKTKSPLKIGAGPIRIVKNGSVVLPTALCPLHTVALGDIFRTEKSSTHGRRRNNGLTAT